MKTEYKFTGFMPSGNPFDWYYDGEKKITFTNSIAVATWDRPPKIGDIITFEREEMVYRNFFYERKERVFINGELVYEETPEKLIKQGEIVKNIYDKLKREKGLIP